jgi:hypothetical protein
VPGQPSLRGQQRWVQPGRPAGGFRFSARRRPLPAELNGDTGVSPRLADRMGDNYAGHDWEHRLRVVREVTQSPRGLGGSSSRSAASRPVEVTFARLALGAAVLFPIVLARGRCCRAPRACGRTSRSRLCSPTPSRTCLFAVAEQAVASST